MKRFMSESKTIKTLCYMLILAMVANFAPLALPSAYAQMVPTYTVAVLDFSNESGVQGDLPARLATDAAVVELSKTNRYDVGITRSQIKAEMDKLDLRPPITRADMVRLGQELSADAILEGSVKSIELSGLGSTRTAKVTLVMELIDQVSGECLNGAVQTGTSYSRVGFNPDDQSLISEAINQAAFLAAKQMTDYVIPEATIHMSVESSNVILNKGVRDNIRPGMRMIVTRQKELVGYITVTSATPIDADAKITKQLRGIRPEDKVKAIFELPVVSKVFQTKNTLPSAAPKEQRNAMSSFSGIGKLLVGAAVIFGVVQAFNGGRGEKGQNISNQKNSNTIIKWDTAKYNHGLNVLQYHIIRDAGEVVRAISDASSIDLGYTDIRSLYGTAAPTAVPYTSILTNPALTTTPVTVNNIPAEAFGTQHTYRVRALYTIVTPGTTTISAYQYSALSNPLRITAIDPVRTGDIIQPAFDPAASAPEISISDLREGTTNFQWNRKDGGKEYYAIFQAVQPGLTGVFDTRSIGVLFEQGPVIELSSAMRTALADFLARSSITSESVMKWQVFTRATNDSSKAWTAGEEGRFVVGDVPPPTP